MAHKRLINSLARCRGTSVLVDWLLCGGGCIALHLQLCPLFPWLQLLQLLLWRRLRLCWLLRLRLCWLLRLRLRLQLLLCSCCN